MAFTIPNEADAFHANQAEPDKVDIDILAAAFNGTSVVLGCAVTESSPAAQTVDVASGIVRINGGIIEVDAQADVSVTAADGTNPRFDLITVNTSGTVVVTAGTAAAEPVLPAIPADDVVLATLYVPANDNTHANNQITDKRVITDALSDLRSGWVKSNMVWGHCTPKNSSAVIPQSEGLLAAGNAVDNSSSSDVDSDGAFFQQNTGATINTDAFLQFAAGETDLVNGREAHTQLRAGFKLSATTSIRFWAGLTDQDGATLVASDNPAGHFVGIRFSTGVPDTNFQAISKDGATQNIQDSGLAGDTAKHFLVITVNEAVPEIIVQILDTDMQEEASVTLIANLPGATTGLKLVCGIENLASSDRNIKQYSFAMTQRG
jgi:hypothetical protein